jgi:hypothetical protein
MPRDKKIIHRATSDVEDETIEEDDDKNNIEFKDTDKLLEERKKYLKEIILKRKLTLKQNKKVESQE